MSAESSASGSVHRALRRSNRTTPTSTTTPAVEVRRPYDHSSAGLRLVSSDGKIFYVDLEIVRAGRQRIKIEQGHADAIEIIFLDEEIEHSDILRDLLNLYYGDPFPDFFSWDDMMHLRQVIRLARRLDSQATIDTISETLRLRLLEDRDDRNWPFGVFVLSSAMDNAELCVAAISKASDLSWSAGLNPNPVRPLDEVVIGENSFDTGTWPTELYCIVPVQFIAALSRATLNEGRPLGSNTDWDAVAGRFLETLTPVATTD